MGGLTLGLFVVLLVAALLLWSESKYLTIIVICWIPAILLIVAVIAGATADGPGAGTIVSAIFFSFFAIILTSSLFDKWAEEHERRQKIKEQEEREAEEERRRQEEKIKEYERHFKQDLSLAEVSKEERTPEHRRGYIKFHYRELIASEKEIEREIMAKLADGENIDYFRSKGPDGQKIIDMYLERRKLVTLAKAYRAAGGKWQNIKEVDRGWYEVTKHREDLIKGKIDLEAERSKEKPEKEEKEERLGKKDQVEEEKEQVEAEEQKEEAQPTEEEKEDATLNFLMEEKKRREELKGPLADFSSDIFEGRPEEEEKKEGKK